MIKINESLKLASIKFKTRKLRNFFSGCSVSLGIIIILVILFGVYGVINVGKESFKDSNVNRYFAIDTQRLAKDQTTDPSSPLIQTENSNPITPITPIKKITKEEYTKENSKYNFKNVYFENYSFYPAHIDSIYKSLYSSTQFEMGSMYPIFTDKTFVDDYLYKNYSFEDKYNGKIPVILPKDYITNLIPQEPNSSPQDKFTKIKDTLDKYIGTEQKLLIGDINSTEQTNQLNKFEINVIIVGFQSDSIYMGGILIPDWAKSNDNLKKVYEFTNQSIISEFNSSKDRDDFVKSKQKDTGNEFSVYSRPNRFEIFEGIINIIKYIGFGVGGFFLLISCLFILTTIGKIVSDSKKEIGVFRAVGGQKWDIMKIFFSYSFLLTTLGFIVGTIISLIFNLGISLIWGDETFYNIVLLGTNYEISRPLFLFIGFPILEFIILYILTLIVGFISTLIPAINAARVDPIKALREE